MDVWRAACCRLLLTAVSITVTAASTQPAAAARLTPGVRVESGLIGSQEHSYEIQLEAGQFSLLKVTPQRIETLVTVNDPAGHPITETSQDVISIVADTAGRYAVRVRARDKESPEGRYSIQVEPPHAASAAERLRTSGDRAVDEARTLIAKDSASARRDALEKLQSAVQLFRQAHHPQGETGALRWLGDLTVGMENGKEAGRGYIEEALAVARTLDDRLPEARALLSLAVSHNTVAERRTGLQYLERAYQLYDAAGSDYGKTLTLSEMGNSWRDLGEYRKALECYDEAVPIAAARNDRTQIARIYNNRGLAHYELGELQIALENFTAALPLSRTTGNVQLEYMVINNTGIIYKELGDYPKALEYYNLSLANARVKRNTSMEAQLLNNIGNVYKAEGRNQESLEIYNQALPIFRRLKMDGGEAMVLNNMGSAFYQLADYQKALEHHQQSGTIRRASGDRRGESSSLNHAGNAWLKLGDVEQALDSLRRSLAIRQEINDPIGEAETLLNLSIVERARGDAAAARQDIEAALAITESLRARISDRGLRASYVARVQETYAAYVDVLMQLHAESPLAGYDAAALQAAERTRARVLLESLVEARADIREGGDAELLAQERALQQKVEAGSERLSRALSGRSTAAQAEQARREFEQLTAEYHAIETRIRSASPRYAALTQPQPLTAAETQQQVLDEGTVLLEFALGAERSWLWAVTPHSITSVALPPRRDLEAAARALYTSLTARQPRRLEANAAYATRVIAADRRLNEQAAAVSRMLFSGIAGQLHGEWRGKRLAIVAAGALEYLPFGALPLPPPPTTLAGRRAQLPLFIARHEIVEWPSATVLATLRREASGRERPRHAVAILADPVFETTDPRLHRSLSPLTSAAPGAGSSPAAVLLPVRTAPGSDDAGVREGFARLPFSREEADAIARIAGPAETFKAVDFRASRATVLGTALADYRIVHFATHGLIDAERPELSGLILSLFNDRGAPQDGFLRLRDIFNMRLNADLVVLSACQTALGKEISGEGLVGLTRGFMYAGAPRVVASLWRVSDVATAELMTRFYAGMLQRRLTPAAALRAAQRQMARDPRWAAPYFWAGFVLQGDWK